MKKGDNKRCEFFIELGIPWTTNQVNILVLYGKRKLK